jgi:hypothetical protein
MEKNVGEEICKTINLLLSEKENRSSDEWKREVAEGRPSLAARLCQVHLKRLVRYPVFNLKFMAG